MSEWLEFLLAIAVFLIGIRLSAFFSGAETGFYRLSVPRLSIDAQAGDRTARRMLWFAQHPAQFVAMTLIGNNVANYLTTVAIGWGVVLLSRSGSHGREVLATIALSPVVFLFGEVLPKNIYFRAPLQRLTKDLPGLRICYYLFLPASWPLVGIISLLQRVRRSEERPPDVLLGRSRLAQVMSHGHREGVLSDVQSRLANGLLHIAPQSVTGSMTPSQRVLGVSASASREEILEFADRYGLAMVAVRRDDDPDSWFASVKVADLVLQPLPVSALLRPLPKVDHCAGKLEALHVLCDAQQSHAVVVDGTKVLGIVSERGLSEQLFRPVPASPAVSARFQN